VARAFPHKGALARDYRATARLAGILRAHCDRRWRYTNLAHGLVRGMIWQSHLDRLGLTSGWPDFMLVGPGKVCFLKLHAPRGHAKPQHGKMAADLIALGCGYGFATTVEDAIDMLKDWGALPLHIEAKP
jgi:hypothetical protein